MSRCTELQCLYKGALYLLLRVKEGRNNLHTVKKKKANWIGYILRGNCLLKHVIGGKIKGIIEVREDKEEEVRSYWMASRKKNRIMDIEDALDRTLWRTRCGRGY